MLRGFSKVVMFMMILAILEPPPTMEPSGGSICPHEHRQKQNHDDNSSTNRSWGGLAGPSGPAGAMHDQPSTMMSTSTGIPFGLRLLRQQLLLGVPPKRPLIVTASACFLGVFGDCSEPTACTRSNDCHGHGNAYGNVPSCTCHCDRNYEGSDCYRRICYIGIDCDSTGTGTVNHYPPCTCSCRAGYNGTTCKDLLCTKEDNCVEANTASVSGIVPSCTCTCKTTHTGSTCEQRYCTREADCVTANTISVTGVAPSCNCMCKAQFGGTTCQTRICHKDYDCQGRGIAIISGTYPNCNCRCRGGYGGRNCRTLSATHSLSITPSRSPVSTDTHPLPRTLSATETFTTSQSLTPAASLSFTHSETATQTISETTSLPPTATISPIETATATLTYSATLNSTLSLSASLTIELSRSETLTGSSSLTCSESISSTSSESATYTLSITTSGTFSETKTCRELDDLGTADTCAVLRPLPSGWAPPTNLTAVADGNANALVMPSSWLLGGRNVSWLHHVESAVDPSRPTDAGGDCTTMAVDFDHWTGRPGSSHVIGIVAVDSRVPLKSSLPFPTMVGDSDFEAVSTSVTVMPLTVVFRTPEQLGNATMNGVAPPPSGDAWQSEESPNTTGQYFIAALTLRYNGPATLNKASYSFRCGQWARCPIAMPAAFTVSLRGSQRLFPEELTAVTEATTVMSTIANAFSMSPTAIVQAGVVSSLREMSRCRDTDLDDPDDNDNYEDYTGGMMNPAGLRLGGGGEGRGYLRGALLMSLVYMILLSSLLIGFSFGTTRLAMAMGGGGDHVVPSALDGYPSAFIGAAAFAMDGAVGAGVMLGVFGSSPWDAVLGWFAVAVSFAYIGHVWYTCTVRFPKRLAAVEISPESRDGPTTHDVIGATTKDQSKTSNDSFSQLPMDQMEGMLKKTSPLSYMRGEEEEQQQQEGGVLKAPQLIGFIDGGCGGEEASAASPCSSDDDSVATAPTHVEAAPVEGFGKLVYRSRGVGRPTRSTTAINSDFDLELEEIASTAHHGPRDTTTSTNTHTATTKTTRRPTVNSGGDDTMVPLPARMLAMLAALGTSSHEWSVAVEGPPPIAANDEQHRRSKARPAADYADEVDDIDILLGIAEDASTHRAVEEGSDDDTQSSGGDPEAAVWLSRYQSYIGDLTVRWYCGFELGVAAVVCLLSSLSYGYMPYCIGRGIVCAVLLTAQAAIMIRMRPVVHRWRWKLLSVVLVVQAVAAALSVANAPLQNQYVELAMDCLGAVVFVAVAIATVIDNALIVMHLCMRAQILVPLLRAWLDRKLSAWWSGRRTFELSPDADIEAGEEMLPALPASEPPAAPTPPAPPLVEGVSGDDSDEAAFIAQTLANLNAFEKRLAAEASGHAYLPESLILMMSSAPTQTHIDPSHELDTNTGLYEAQAI